MAPPECEGEGKEVAIMVVDAAKDMESSPVREWRRVDRQRGNEQGTDFGTPDRESFGMHVWCGNS